MTKNIPNRSVPVDSANVADQNRKMQILLSEMRHSGIPEDMKLIAAVAARFHVQGNSVDAALLRTVINGYDLSSEKNPLQTINANSDLYANVDELRQGMRKFVTAGAYTGQKVPSSVSHKRNSWATYWGESP